MDKGNLSHIKSYSKKKNIYEQIHIYGFVNENELINIYLESLFVVVPTFFGPTNLPVLEGISLGKTVFYSNIHCFDKEIENVINKFDINNKFHLSELIYHYFKKESYYKQKINKGLKLLIVIYIIKIISILSI